MDWGCVVGLTIAWLTILGLIETVHAIASGGAGVAGIVGRAHSTSSRHLSITSVVNLLVALPEWTLAARRIVVAWAWTLMLLLLVMTDEKNLHDSGDQEEEDHDECDCEGCGLELTCLMEVWKPGGAAIWRGCVGLTVAERSSDVTLARAGAVSCFPNNVDECAHKSDVQGNGDEAEEGNTAQEHSEEDGEEEVEDCSARDAFNCLQPCRDEFVMVGKDSQEI